MKNWSLLFGKLKTLGWLLTMGVSMSACSATTMTWKEEVKLHDGQVITSERFYHVGGYAYLDSTERTPLDETVTFILSGTSKQVVWQNNFNDTVPEPNSLNHFRFDIVNGVPYLATYPAGCIAYNKWGRPNPPQILFKYENEQWKRIPLAELPPELIGTTANVIVGRPPAKLLKPFYTVDQVNDQNFDIHTPAYKTILREALPTAAGVCGEMVYDGNGGWIGIGWFRKQPTYEACLKYCEREKMPAEYCPCTTLFKGK